MLSISQSKLKGYPDGKYSFSPGRRYPEYPFEELDPRQEGPYDQVREVIRQLDLDSSNYGRKEWNPLGRWIHPGQRVFILCNFVQERRFGQTPQEQHAKCSHGSVLRAVCDYALIALKGEGEILIGNAPLQSTNWDRVLSETGAANVLSYYQKKGLPVRPADLRMLRRPRALLGHLSLEGQNTSEEESVEVDFSASSLLRVFDRPLASECPKFRVMDYDPNKTERYQSFGRHVYVINKQFLQSDVVINVPKLKTHEKVGITCGLKGFVGIVGHKDCLAHHRFGALSEGGDEYPRVSVVRRWQSQFHENLNAQEKNSTMKQLGLILDRNLTRVLARLGSTYGGAWHGNDTCWRMALDLAQIAHFADQSGSLRKSPQRTHLCFIDGIVAGEGKGPLSPSPIAAGVVIFSDSVAIADAAACKLMGFDPEVIPLVRQAFSRNAFPLAEMCWQTERVVLNGAALTLEAIKPAVGRSFLPSPGWRDWLQQKRAIS